MSDEMHTLSLVHFPRKSFCFQSNQIKTVYVYVWKRLYSIILHFKRNLHDTHQHVLIGQDPFGSRNDDTAVFRHTVYTLYTTSEYISLAVCVHTVYTLYTTSEYISLAVCVHTVYTLYTTSDYISLAVCVHTVYTLYTTSEYISLAVCVHTVYTLYTTSEYISLAVCVHTVYTLYTTSDYISLAHCFHIVLKCGDGEDQFDQSCEKCCSIT
jgi:hypothetical protein